MLKGPLFPLNSLMLHGIIYAKHAKNLNTDPVHDFAERSACLFWHRHELQEMYITPSLLTDANWDSLAEAAAGRARTPTYCVDTHWIGGDPGRLDVYGWASWSPRKAILVLRNPSDRPKTINLDIAKAFELPTDAARTYQLRSPWKEDRGLESLRVAAGQPHTFSLKPFEVLVLEGTALR